MLKLATENTTVFSKIKKVYLVGSWPNECQNYAQK